MVGKAFVSIVVIMGLVVMLFGISTCSRKVSNMTAAISVQEVEPGVRCALATTDTSSSVACWKVVPDEEATITFIN